jgi:L-threonylcarbamoyladenylate synthase
VNRETIQKVIEQAIFILQEGGVILYPADTIWGIGCDAANQEAVKRVYAIKGRSFNKPLIVLVPDLNMVYEVAKAVHPRIDTLLHYHERPLTIIYPKVNERFRHLAGPDGSIGVRIVLSGFCHELLAAYGRPLVSTSANLSGEPTPVKFGNISSAIIRQVDFALPAYTENDMTGRPSAIARYDDNGELDFIR